MKTADHAPPTHGPARWDGNPGHLDNPHRSLPFASITPLLSRTDADWRGLQFGPAAAVALPHLLDDRD